MRHEADEAGAGSPSSAETGRQLEQDRLRQINEHAAARRAARARGEPIDEVPPQPAEGLADQLTRARQANLEQEALRQRQAEQLQDDAARAQRESQELLPELRQAIHALQAAGPDSTAALEANRGYARNRTVRLWQQRRAFRGERVTG